MSTAMFIDGIMNALKTKGLEKWFYLKLIAIMLVFAIIITAYVFLGIGVVIGLSLIMAFISGLISNALIVSVIGLILSAVLIILFILGFFLLTSIYAAVKTNFTRDYLEKGSLELKTALDKGLQSYKNIFYFYALITGIIFIVALVFGVLNYALLLMFGTAGIVFTMLSLLMIMVIILAMALMLILAIPFTFVITPALVFSKKSFKKTIIDWIEIGKNNYSNNFSAFALSFVIAMFGGLMIFFFELASQAILFMIQMIGVLFPIPLINLLIMGIAGILVILFLVIDVAAGQVLEGIYWIIILKTYLLDISGAPGKAVPKKPSNAPKTRKK